MGSTFSTTCLRASLASRRLLACARLATMSGAAALPPSASAPAPPASSSSSRAAPAPAPAPAPPLAAPTRMSGEESTAKTSATSASVLPSGNQGPPPPGIIIAEAARGASSCACAAACCGVSARCACDAGVAAPMPAARKGVAPRGPALICACACACRCCMSAASRACGVSRSVPSSSAPSTSTASLPCTVKRCSSGMAWEGEGEGARKRESARGDGRGRKETNRGQPGAQEDGG